MGKFVQDLIKEVLVDKCFTDGMGNYFYVREINEDGTTYCLSLDCDELRVNQELELNDISDLELITKKEFLDALTAFIKDIIEYK